MKTSRAATAATVVAAAVGAFALRGARSGQQAEPAPPVLRKGQGPSPVALCIGVVLSTLWNAGRLVTL